MQSFNHAAIQRAQQTLGARGAGRRGNVEEDTRAGIRPIKRKCVCDFDESKRAKLLATEITDDAGTESEGRQLPVPERKKPRMRKQYLTRTRDLEYIE